MEIPETYVIAKFNCYVQDLILRESQRSLRKKELQALNEVQHHALQKMLGAMSQKFTAHFAIAMKNVDSQTKDHFKEFVEEIAKNHRISDKKDDFKI